MDFYIYSTAVISEVLLTYDRQLEADVIRGMLYDPEGKEVIELKLVKP